MESVKVFGTNELLGVFDLFDFITFVVVFLTVGFIINQFVSRALKFERNENRTLLLALVFRMLLTYYYYYYFAGQAADIGNYFYYAASNEFSLNGLLTTSTQFINNVCSLFYPFARPFGNQYLMLFVPFALLGHCGALLFYSVCRRFESVDLRVRRVLALFLPNLVFWTSNMGKDSLIFFGFALVIFGILDKRSMLTRVLTIVSGFLLVFSIRPHSGLILLVSFLLGIVFQSSKQNVRSIFILIIAMAAFFMTYGKALDFVGIKISEDETKDAVETISDIYGQAMVDMNKRSVGLNVGAAATGASPVDLLKSPFYFISFIGGPFIWQARKPIHVASALESIIYQLMLLYIMLNWRYYFRQNLLEMKYAWALYVILSSVILGMSYANFGLTIRQKCMVIPEIVLIYLAIRNKKDEEKALALEETEE